MCGRTYGQLSNQNFLDAQTTKFLTHGALLCALRKRKSSTRNFVCSSILLPVINSRQALQLDLTVCTLKKMTYSETHLISNRGDMLVIHFIQRLECVTRVLFKIKQNIRWGKTNYCLVITLTPESHMEVGCLGTWGLEPLTPNPGRKNTPKACPIHIPGHEPHPPHSALAQAPVTLNREFSGEIRTMLKCTNNNNKGWGGEVKAL